MLEPDDLNQWVAVTTPSAANGGRDWAFVGVYSDYAVGLSLVSLISAESASTWDTGFPLGSNGYEKAVIAWIPLTAGWKTVGIIGGNGAIPSASATGDLSSCPNSNCKLSDDAINAIGFTLLRFAPISSSASAPITYFDMSSRTFNSTASVLPCNTPWTLSESDALSGVCCTQDLNCSSNPNLRLT